MFPLVPLAGFACRPGHHTRLDSNVVDEPLYRRRLVTRHYVNLQPHLNSSSTIRLPLHEALGLPNRAQTSGARLADEKILFPEYPNTILSDLV